MGDDQESLDSQPTLAAQLRAAAQEARAQDLEAPAQPPPGPQVWMSPELAETLAGVLEAASDRAYECDCQGRDVRLDSDITIHLVMEGCSHDDALHDALEVAEAIVR